MQSRTILEINHVTKRYQSKKQTVKALDDISFTIKEGEVFCLLGVNGAGKTTLSSILAALHPLSSGKVLFRGTSIYDDIVAYKAHLGFCPQQQNLDMFLSVRENLIFAGRYLLMPEKELQERTDFLLEKFSLSDYADFKLEQLSGGNKQKLLIARSIMHNPKIVILDEPTVGLDPDIRRKIWELILDLKKLGITTILTTHYLDEAEYLSDRICILDKGKIILIESVKELKARHGNAKLEEIFLSLIKERNETSDV